MKASDYVVKYLIKRGITDVFGYPGGMVTHFMDALNRCSSQINTHLNYHEQASAMAACGYAEVTGKPGVAYATSGPGATNLITGIACAYFESLPCVFITGQVNTYEQKGERDIRQRGFQETDIVSIVKPITKLARKLSAASELPEALNEAFETALNGRQGPVLLDIPMDVFRGQVSETPEVQMQERPQEIGAVDYERVIELIETAKRPLILAGHGIRLANCREDFIKLVHAWGIPVVTSMIAVDVLPSDDEYNFGMVGAYGCRHANFLINHCDLLITLGSRADCRQTGVNRDIFAPDAVIVRVDIDKGELNNKFRESDVLCHVSLDDFLAVMNSHSAKVSEKSARWLRCCGELRRLFAPYGSEEPGNKAAELLSTFVPSNAVITTDVGQNQVWIAQSFKVKEGQRLLFSGGHGAMGYSLPAAIGAAVCTQRPIVCCAGDGGIQMNIQELQTVVREKLPIKIVVFNNSTLGMIHHFQEMYFDSEYAQTDSRSGYTVPDLASVARAYGMKGEKVELGDTDTLSRLLHDEGPALLDIVLPETTHVFPKLGMNKPIHIQEPPLPEGFLEGLEKYVSKECGNE